MNFFQKIDSFVQQNIFSISREYAKNKDEGIYTKYNIESEIERFFQENMSELIRKKVKISWAIMNDWKTMFIWWEVLLLQKKDFVDFMKEIYEEFEHKRLRDLAKLQWDIARIDFYEEMKKAPKYATNGKDIFVNRDEVNKTFYSMISNYGKM